MEMNRGLKNKLLQVLELLIINDHTSVYFNGLIERRANRKKAIEILSNLLAIEEEDLESLYIEYLNKNS